MKEYIVQAKNNYDFWDLVMYQDGKKLEELIRCENCKFYQTADFTDGFTCYLAEGIAFAKEDDFCSKAERKD